MVARFGARHYAVVMNETSKPNRISAASLKAARMKLGLSVDDLAMLLRMSANGDRKIRRWENGDEEISGPASVAIEALLSGWRPD